MIDRHFMRIGLHDDNETVLCAKKLIRLLGFQVVMYPRVFTHHRMIILLTKIQKDMFIKKSAVRRKIMDTVGTLSCFGTDHTHVFQD